MKTLYLATKNRHKVSELQALLRGADFIVKDVSEFADYEAPEETGTTFLENAEIKARALRDFILKTKQEAPFILADDSGLCCDDLNGAPGVLSARFAGPNASDAQNNAKLIAELAKIKSPTRQAHYVCALVWLTPENKTVKIEETCAGKIISAPRGHNGFGYDPYFWLDEFQMTMAELPPEHKNRISHRGKALKTLFNFIVAAT